LSAVAYAGCVLQSEGVGAYGDGVFDDVSGGAVDVADDGALVAYEGVE